MQLSSLVRRVAVVAAAPLVVAGGWLAVPPAGAAAPTIKMSPATAGPGAYVTISGSNWTAGDSVTITIFGTGMCSLTPATGGAITPSACLVPNVPVGTHTLSALQSATGLSATQSITIKPQITSISSGNLSPGAATTLYGAGFKQATGLVAYLDSTTSTPLTTNPASPTTDSTGSFSNLAVNMPTGATAGTHTLILQDAAGHKATTPIVIYTPTLSVSTTKAGTGTIFSFTGSGWRPNDNVELILDTSGFCGSTANSSGVVSYVCTVPGAAGGAHALFAEQDNFAIVSASKTFTITPRVTYNPSPAVSPGGTVFVEAGAFAPNSALTVTLSGVTGDLTTNPASPTSDANGNIGSLTVTIPTTAKVGTQTLTITDASSDKATTKVFVYKPTASAGVTSTSPSQYVLFSGSGFAPNIGVGIYLNGTIGICTLTPDNTGSFASDCGIPAVPAGSYSLVFEQNSFQVSVSKTMKIVPIISNNIQYPDVTAGANVNIPTMYGFSASTTVTATLSGVSGHLTTNPSSPTTDTNGSLSNVVVTIPASVSAGNHTLTISDGTHTTTATISVYAPSITLTEKSGPSGSTYGVTGTGLWPNDPVYIYFGSTYTCQVSANGSGVINGPCTVPALAAGSYAVSAQQPSTEINVSLGNFTISS